MLYDIILAQLLAGRFSYFNAGDCDREQLKNKETVFTRVKIIWLPDGAKARKKIGHLTVSESKALPWTCIFITHVILFLLFESNCSFVGRQWEITYVSR